VCQNNTICYDGFCLTWLILKEVFTWPAKISSNRKFYLLHAPLIGMRFDQCVIFDSKTKEDILIDKFIMNGIQRELGIFFHDHLGHDAGAVSADGFNA
jgi:hypothetical protein